MTKTQKRNARARRAKLRARGCAHLAILVSYNSYLETVDNHSCQRDCQTCTLSGDKAGLLLKMEKANCAAKSKGLPDVRTKRLLRMGTWTWETTSHEGFSADQLAELKEVLTHVWTADSESTSSSGGNFTAEVTCEIFAGTEEEEQRSLKWQIVGGEVEGLVAELVAALSQ